MCRALLEDIKNYLRSSPGQVDWNRVQLNDIGARLVNGPDGAKYLGQAVAKWDLALEPLPGHFDRLATVSTPIQNAGAYLVTATVAGGNVSRIILWLDDTVLIKKPLQGSYYYYAADSRTGTPVAGANLNLFGWRQQQIDNKNQFRTEIKEQNTRTDASGQAIVPAPNPNEGQYQWLITARTAQGRLAFLGFTNIWRVDVQDPFYDQVKVLTITDRPVYRPGNEVKFKFWVQHTRYDRPDKSDFAGQIFTVQLHNPKNEKIFEKTFKADEFGGFDGTFELPSDAGLGVYQLFVLGYSISSFRVEEYKKPEFEVTIDAPDKPVMLGEKITAKITAKYLFGAPVSQGKVKYKVTRSSTDERWFPVARWDWLFGPGYWWFAGDYTWYPGWSRWGTWRPVFWWWSRPMAPPEVVADAEVTIKPDGTVAVEIDTALAKATHPDQDHRYEITAEVTDQSRRTITGTGTVLVAREPFKVYTWLDRGHYRVGDTIHAGISAQRLDHKPVKGEGTLKLLKVSYGADRQPIETPVQSWPLTTDDDGQAVADHQGVGGRAISPVGHAE